jgi:hypothetical protein
MSVLRGEAARRAHDRVRYNRRHAPTTRPVRTRGPDSDHRIPTARPVRAERPGNTSETPAWIEPPLPNGAKRTYLTSGGSAAVAVAFLVFVAILLGYFSSSTSWARW